MIDPMTDAVTNTLKSSTPQITGGQDLRNNQEPTAGDHRSREHRVSVGAHSAGMSLPLLSLLARLRQPLRSGRSRE